MSQHLHLTDGDDNNNCASFTEWGLTILMGYSAFTWNIESTSEMLAASVVTVICFNIIIGITTISFTICSK